MKKLDNFYILFVVTLPPVLLSRVIYSGIVQYIVDNRTKISTVNSICKTVILTILIITVLTVGQIINKYFQNKLIYEKIQSLQYNVLHNHFIKKNDNILTDLEKKMNEIEIHFYRPFTDSIKQLLILIITSLVMYSYSSIILLFIFCISIVTVLISNVFIPYLIQFLDERNILNEEYSVINTDIEQGRFEIKMHNAIQYAFNRFEAVLYKIKSNKEKNALFKETLSSLDMWIMCISGIFITIYGIHLIQEGSFTLGKLMFVNTLSSGITKSIKLFIDDYVEIKSSKSLLKNLNTRKSIINFSKYEDKSEFETLSIKNAVIKYGNHVILDCINIDVNMGDKILITGENGTGKSSLLKCILGINRFDSSDLFLNHYKVDLFSNNLFGYVPQNIFIIDETVSDYLDVKEADMEKIMQIFDIFRLERKLIDKPIEKMGYNLSSGQKQKLAIIKAIVSDRPILVLDEALSGVDDISREIIINYISNLNRTILMIEHYDIDKIQNHSFKTINLNKKVDKC